MSSSPLPPTHSRRPSNDTVVYVSIDYREVLSLIKSHASVPERERNKEINELLSILVLQYFDLPVGGKPREMLQRYNDLLENMSDLIKQPSVMQTDVGLMLTTISRQYLPRFRAYSTEDCQAINSSRMEGTTLVLAMTYGHFKKFTAAQKKSDNPFSSGTGL